MSVATHAEGRVSRRIGTDRLETTFTPIEPVSYTTTAMGGRLAIHLEAHGRADEAQRDSRRLVARVDRWAARLTRHTEISDLAKLNADPSSSVAVGPVLAAALMAGMHASDASEGFTDITLLDARLAAEGKSDLVAASRLGEWQIVRRPRGAAVIRRPFGLRFDLGGIGKGWIADRALALLGSWPSAVVDADGDLAVRCSPGECWDIGIEDPRTDGVNLAVLRLTAVPGGAPTRWGVATSGTSIHRWNLGGTVSHHLIDPRTGRPARTDVVQATVVAETALRAEALAKAAVIAGSVEGFALLERARVRGAVLLTTRNEVQALPVTLPLLAG
ncbi:MAG: FAD:protein FMN transferase [Candidatus Limnocylindrales bacterium]